MKDKGLENIRARLNSLEDKAEILYNNYKEASKEIQKEVKVLLERKKKNDRI